MWPHILMALFALGWAIAFNVGVRVYFAELVAVGAICFVAPFATLKRFPPARSILAAYSIWVAAIVLSDAMNGTAAFDMARSVATPVLGGISLLFALSALSHNPNAIFTFLAVTVVSKAILGDPAYGDKFAEFEFSWASVEANTNYFKVRFAPALTPAIVLFACLASRRGFLSPAITCIFASMLYFLLDARSGGLVFFLAALALLAVQLRFKPKPIQILVASALTLPIMYLAYVLYVDYSLKSGATGNTALQLSRIENPYNPFALLVQGRSELTVAVDAISERPLFGHGSWAKDTDLKYTTLRQERTGGELQLHDTLDQEQRIPVHSTFVAMWLWSGVLGALAGGLLAAKLISLLLQLFDHRSNLLAAGFVFAFALFWDFMFSPPQVVRLSFPIGIAVLLVLARIKNKAKKNMYATSAVVSGRHFEVRK